MRAALCKAFEGPDHIILDDVPDPSPGENQVVVVVRAAALNFFDTLMTRNQYQYKPELPFSPCAECAGVISARGAAVTGFEVGARVVAYTTWGSCRERVAVDAQALVPVPEGVDDATAAGVTVTYGTAIHGLKDRGGVAEGETVAVLGASGGAGLAAVEIAKLMGARVIAVASSPAKLEACRTHGADDLVDYSRQDLKTALKELTGGRGVDVVYDCVGGVSAEAALRATAWGGRFLVIGFASGEIPRIPLNLVLLKGCSVVGVFWGDFLKRDPHGHRDNITQVLEWCAEGRLRPHIHGTYPLEQTADALKLIEDRKAVGKVIITP